MGIHNNNHRKKHSTLYEFGYHQNEFVKVYIKELHVYTMVNQISVSNN